MKFTMSRDRVIASVYGHAIEFKKGVPTLVPDLMIKEVLAAGGEPDEPVDEPEADTPEVRADKILAAVKRIVERATEGELSTDGVPHPSVVSKECGFGIDAKERDAAMLRLKAGDD